jgi:anti-sigma regulatory factor (Ser/Thr protein kinase)
MGLKVTIDRGDILRLAADTGLDPRTVKRAIEHGVDALKAEVDRTRLRDAAKRLGVALR